MLQPSDSWLIYLLIDPRVTSGRAQDEVRYVGFSSNFTQRFSDHLKEVSPNVHKNNWISCLRSLGLRPLYRIVDSGLGNTWQPVETHWIRFYRDEVGAKLLNLTDGGEGVPGHVHSDETRLLISTRLREPEIRSKLLLALNSPEYKLKQSLAHKGKPHLISAEGSLLISESNKLRPQNVRVASARKGAEALHAGRTPELRSQRAREAALARWSGR